jgi:hypothetical protein
MRIHTKILSVLCYVTFLAASPAIASELVHQFNSPAFNGSGYSSHVLTIDQLEKQRQQKIKDERQSAIVNVESRIYAQLSKQLADQMFAEGGKTNGTMDFQGTSISWVKTGSDVTLTILETNGNRTDITVPISGFSF